MNNMYRPSENIEECSENLLRTGEVARILKIHPNTVRSLVEKGELSPVRHNMKKGGHYRFYENDVMRLLTVQTNGKYVKTNQLEYETKMKILNEAELLNSEQDIRRFAKAYINNNDERTIFDTLVSAMNPYVIFGSYMERVDEKEYSRMLQGKDEVWVTESLRASTPKGRFKTKGGRSMLDLLESMIEVGYGCVNGYMKTFIIVNLLQSQKTFAMDGTIQQMYPCMRKGILVLQEDEMNALYTPLHRIALSDYLDIVLKLKTSVEKEQALHSLVGEEYKKES